MLAKQDYSVAGNSTTEATHCPKKAAEHCSTTINKRESCTNGVNNGSQPHTTSNFAWNTSPQSTEYISQKRAAPSNPVQEESTPCKPPPENPLTAYDSPRRQRERLVARAAATAATRGSYYTGSDSCCELPDLPSDNNTAHCTPGSQIALTLDPSLRYPFPSGTPRPQVLASRDQTSNGYNVTDEDKLYFSAQLDSARFYQGGVNSSSSNINNPHCGTDDLRGRELLGTPRDTYFDKQYSSGPVSAPGLRTHNTDACPPWMDPGCPFEPRNSRRSFDSVDSVGVGGSYPQPLHGSGMDGPVPPGPQHCIKQVSPPHRVHTAHQPQPHHLSYASHHGVGHLSPPSHQLSTHQQLGGVHQQQHTSHQNSLPHHQQQNHQQQHQQHHQHGHQQQQHTQQQTQQHTQQHAQQQQQQQLKSVPFCSQLPDSPPDSDRSEPYSPTHVENHPSTGDPNQQQLNYKAMTSLAQQMQPYLGHNTPHHAHGPNSHTPPHTQGSPCSQIGNAPPPHSHGPSAAHTHAHLAALHHAAAAVAAHHPGALHPMVGHGQGPNGGQQQGQRPPTYPGGGGYPGLEAGPPPGVKLHHPGSVGGVPVPPPHGMALNPQMLPVSQGYNPMNNLANQASKKRKYESPNGTVTAAAVMNGLGMTPSALLNIKPEPAGLLDCDDDSYGGYGDFCSEMGGAFMEGAYQVIKWQPFEPKTWCTLLDHNYKEQQIPNYRVDADKGFNFSVSDDAFVCQKKNHFQVTSHVELHGRPKFIKTQEGKVKPIESFYLHFYGIKAESHSQLIKVEQSQSDRSKKPFHPVRVDLLNEPMSKLTVGRLHFSETTTNNMRKKGKPNPDQRYFMLVVAFRAHTSEDPDGLPIVASSSERIIVRASNPGQFDQEVDATWQKGHAPDTVYHAGRVGINTDRPDETLTVHGNVKVTGHVIQPSDRRLKSDLKELDPRQQLENISRLKVYEYSYTPEYSEFVGKDPEERDTGVIAQELREVLPDAVRETGDLELPEGDIQGVLGINKDRIYMENIGAVKELCKVTTTLETRINELEHMNKKLSKASKLYRHNSERSTCSTVSTCALSTISGHSTLSRPDKELKDKDTKERENVEKQDKPEKYRSHHHHHSKHRHSSDGRRRSAPAPAQEENLLCSPRRMQISIVVLVLIMAFCLFMMGVIYLLLETSPDPKQIFIIAITALYVLDKSSDQSQTHPTPSIFENPNNDTADGNVTSRPFTRPPDLPSPIVPLEPEPLARQRCLEPREDCHLYCCYPPANTQGFTTTTVHPNDPDCHDHDCGPRYTVRPDGKNDIPAEGDSYEVIIKQNPKITPSENDTPKEVDDTPVQYDPNVMDYEDTGNPYVFINDGSGARRKRHVDHDFNVKANLVLYDTNRTIGNQYCHNNQCRDGFGGTFQYIIPLAATFPPDYATIDFRFPNNGVGLVVKLCNYSQLYECSQHVDVTPGLHAQSNHSWFLPIGYYAESYYLLRVAPSSVENACEMDGARVGQDFAEYWLQFYRKGDASCTANDIIMPGGGTPEED